MASRVPLAPLAQPAWLEPPAQRVRSAHLARQLDPRDPRDLLARRVPPLVPLGMVQMAWMVTMVLRALLVLLVHRALLATRVALAQQGCLV